ncbi:MAG: Ldh family oxidoreductase [Armatimonadetes bacterium]|nr:Ldh family oxidoreductase [Armatimonadota bacterium]
MSSAQKGVATKRFPEAVVRKFATGLLLAMGSRAEDAELVADGITTAALRWHPGQGQGLEKFFRYHRRYKIGGSVPNAEMSWDREGPSFALLNANDGWGYVAGQKAMRKAMALAAKTGVALVGVRNSDHFGIAGYHAKTAADGGFIGISMTNARAEMAPWGGKTAVLGTNPWGLAIPRRNAHPIVLDMALTMAGQGMINWAAREGQPVPDDWALTKDGKRTTNPLDLLQGATQLPIGKYKGSGLSFFTDAITGVLMGAKFGLSVFQDEKDFDVSHVMIAVHVESFMPLDRFYDRLDQLIHEVKSAAPINPGEEILLPGDAELRRMEERKKSGIPIDAESIEKLRVIAAELGAPFLLE